MHLVIDPNDHRLLIAKIGHLNPGMHGEGVAGRCKAVLTKNLIRKGLSAFELVGVIAGSPVLYLDRLLVLAEYGSRQETEGKQPVMNLRRHSLFTKSPGAFGAYRV
jgi:hypothetical protein